MFDKARDVLSTEEAEALGDRMAAEKQKLGAPVPARVCRQKCVIRPRR